MRQLFEQKELVVLPTETIYGIACLIEPVAFEKLYAAKLRSYDKPLPVLISDLNQVDDLTVEIPEIFWKLADKFLPGALSIVLKKNPKLNYACFDGNSVVIRFSSHQTTQKIAKTVGRPLLLSSANLSGGPNLESPEEIQREIGLFVAAIVDDGNCANTVASTIVSLLDPMPKIVREGAISKSDIEKVIGHRI